MKRQFAVWVLFASAAWAQHWEAGVLAGGGIYLNHASLSSPAGSARAGIGKGPAFGAFLVQNLYSRLSGEIRYVYQRGDLQLSSGSSRAAFRGDTHALHYDWVLHLAGREAKIRPFLAAGAGFKLYRGIGTETVTQPLEGVALLTRASEWKPLVTVGAGVAIALSESVCLRLEFRDYMTPFPKRVIAPVSGTGGVWLHDLSPALAVSIRF